jgi:hypothetical protein
VSTEAFMAAGPIRAGGFPDCSFQRRLTFS